MTYTVPTSFEPLASSNPVPADTDAMTTLGQQYTATAQLIQSQAQTLTTLTNGSSESWQSQAGTVFVSKASSLATRITQAQQRYATAGSALSGAAEPMYNAQQSVYAAVQQAQEAQSTMNANAPGPAPAPGSPAPTAAQQSAAKTAASNYSDAQDSLNQATSQFNSAVDDYKDAASAAAKSINDELSGDPLKDSWFQAHFDWLLKILHILAIIGMALAAIALIIALPGVGALIDGVGLTLAASITTGVITGIEAGIGITTTVIDGMGAHDGLESWKSFAMDIVGDFAIGIGAGVSKVASTIAKSATGATEDAASAAAKTSTVDKATADGAADFLKNNATTTISNDALTAGAKAAGDAAGKNVVSAADAAGSAAAKGVSTSVENAENAIAKSLTGNLAGFASTNGDIVDKIAGLNSIIGTIPSTSATVGSAIGKIAGIGAANGALQWASTGMGIYGIATG